MQVTAEQAAALQMLVRMTGAIRCLELGVFTGYSALAVALALPPQGRIVALRCQRGLHRPGARLLAEAGVDGQDRPAHRPRPPIRWMR